MKKQRTALFLGIFLFLLTLGLTGFRADAASDVLTLNTPKVRTVRAGFNPGSGNGLPIFTTLKVNLTDSGQAFKVRLRILTAKDQMVFQKTFPVPSADGATLLLFYQWNGKASSNNKAELPAGKYVPAGKYKVEAQLYAPGKSATIPSVRKRASFTVSKSALTGAKALGYARGTVVTYSGYSDIDYLAELMVKAAGVTVNMSDDAKVKQIYHYMTQNFKHIKAWDYYNSSYKLYYNVNKLKKQISQFDETVYKKWVKGEILFDNDLAGYMIDWTMPRRVGVCDDNAELFRLLLAHVGVQSGLCHGYYLNRSGSKSGHTWNWVLVNGTMYYYDVDVEIINYGKGQGDYYWYKESLAASKKRHQYISADKRTALKTPQWQGW